MTLPRDNEAGSDRAAQDQPRAFQAEVSRLLHLMVHSVYSEREIFLRELISNASDALEKLRTAALTEPDLLAGDATLAIRIRANLTERTLTVSDTGIGMDAEELADNLGTIARSGTRAALEAMDEKAGAALIGQFGVGFYSAFMVADEVRVVSRKAGQSRAHVWHCKGLDGFTVTVADEADAHPRGTSVTLYLKDDALAFMEDFEIERLVRSYSDHISFPILLEGADEPRQLNRASALWMRSKAEVKPEEYTEFYRHVAHQPGEPAITIHYRAEGRSEYSVLLFIPAERPFDLFNAERKGRVKLYVRRVFITDDAELLPAYLRFVRGVIDSQDMPLNLSREMLQKNPHVGAIQKAVTNRVLGDLAELAGRDAAAYDKLWEIFGAVIKEGLYEDPSRRDKLLELARFHTTKDDASSWRSLKEYVAAMRPNQTAIYYLVGEDLERLKASPQLEGFRARGIEVLLLTDPVDNFWVTSAIGFDGKPFRSITQGEAELAQVPKLEAAEPAPEEAAPPVNAATLLARLKSVLGKAVSDVRVSDRLVASPACIVAPDSGPDRGLEKILLRHDKLKGMAPVLEINAAHPVIRALEKETGSQFEDLAWLVLDQARILDGELPQDAARFADRLNRLLASKSP